MTELMDTEATKLEEGEEGTAAVPLSEGLGTTVEHAEAPSSTVEHPEAPNPASHLQIDVSPNSFMSNAHCRSSQIQDTNSL